MRVRILDTKDLRRITGEDWVDRSRKVYRRGGQAYVPVREGFPYDTVLPERTPYTGRGYCMLGSVAILHGATPSAVEVRQVAERTAAAAVLHLSSIDGVMREPSIRVLTGTPGEVVLRENGITYRLDPTRVMFAMGNRTERARMGTIVTAGERVGDLCAGIGYFTIPMARAGASVHAIEINPVAYSYLCRNAQENGVEGRVSAVLGDCRECMDGTYDRIVIGHFEAVRFLPEALEHARKGSVLHLHGLSSDRFDIARCTAESGFTAAEKVRLVKKYGPHTWHVVRDVVLQ